MFSGIVIFWVVCFYTCGGLLRDLLLVVDGRYSCFPGEYWYSLIGQSVYENRIGFLDYDLVRSISTSWFDAARRVIYN